MARGGSNHWVVVKRVMRCVKGTIDARFCLEDIDILLSGYYNVDYTSDTNDRGSTTCFMFKVSFGAVLWNSNCQQTTATSTIEAKYMPTSHGTKGGIWLRQLMADVRCRQHDAIPIMCDNQGSMSLAKNPTDHSHTKHIDVKYDFIQKKLEMG